MKGAVMHFQVCKNRMYSGPENWLFFGYSEKTMEVLLSNVKLGEINK